MILLAIVLDANGQLTEQEMKTQLTAIEEFRTELHREFLDSTETPLPKDSIQGFKGHEYYPVQKELIFKAKFEPIDKGRLFEMKTTTDRAPYYQDYAIISFDYKGETYSLHAYRNIELSKTEGYEDYLFLPFKDHTNGNGSYGGGRYLDLQRPDAEEIILDFNQSYNPYCAYNPRYSCPIPPKENHLELEIEAGIRLDH